MDDHHHHQIMDRFERDLQLILMDTNANNRVLEHKITEAAAQRWGCCEWVHEDGCKMPIKGYTCSCLEALRAAAAVAAQFRD
jgi:hypothetical protein